MSKAKEDYYKYLDDIKNGEIISEKADNIFIRYIAELKELNKDFLDCLDNCVLHIEELGSYHTWAKDILDKYNE